MIKPYKGRELEEGQLVQVYRNLHNKMLSIRCSKTRLVLAHGTDFVVKNAKPVVNQRARERVNEKKLRTVHAYLEGEYCGLLSIFSSGVGVVDEVYYNPYETKSFMLQQQNRAFGGGDIVVRDSKVYKTI